MANGTGRPNTRRATPRVSHGDTTGNLAINLGKEHAAMVREREGEMSMVNGPRPEVEEPIEDLTEEGLAARDEAADDAWEAENGEVNMTPPPPPEEPEEPAAAASGNVGDLSIVALPRERPRGALRSVSRDGKRDPNEPVIVRFNDDYPGVTLGKDPRTDAPRTFNFEAGRKYKLSRWAAEHFEDKEMLA